MKTEEWPHPDRCPGSMCRGQFFWIKHYGIICTIKLEQLTGGKMSEVFKLSDEARLEKFEGLGIS